MSLSIPLEVPPSPPKTSPNRQVDSSISTRLITEREEAGRSIPLPPMSKLKELSGLAIFGREPLESRLDGIDAEE